jgi:hypothetical protein
LNVVRLGLVNPWFMTLTAIRVILNNNSNVAVDKVVADKEIQAAEFS